MLHVRAIIPSICVTLNRVCILGPGHMSQVTVSPRSNVCMYPYIYICVRSMFGAVDGGVRSRYLSTAVLSPVALNPVVSRQITYGQGARDVESQLSPHR